MSQNKRSRSICNANITSLPILVEKLTTSGKDPVEDNLHTALIQRILTSADVCETLRLIIQQLQQPHAQIRLGALQLVSVLSDPDIFSGALPLDQDCFRRAYEFRDMFILQLQDIAPFLLPSANTDKPLPPPTATARLLQKQTLQLLLRWERDISQTGAKTSLKYPWRPPIIVRCQLFSFMRYLRSRPISGCQHACFTRLNEIRTLLSQLEQSARAEEQLHSQKKFLADAIFRRQLLASKEKYNERKDEISANLTCLEAIINLLVPDLFYESRSQFQLPDSAKDFPISASTHPREHGILFGSTSGFAASFNSSGVSINLEVAPRSVSGSKEPCVSSEFVPCMRIPLTDDVRILHYTGKEFVEHATKIHRPILENYIKLTELCSSTSSRGINITDSLEARLELVRLQKLTEKFSNAILFEEEPKDNAKHPLRDLKSQFVSDSSDEEEDLVEVPPLQDDDENSIQSSSSPPAKKIKIKRSTRASFSENSVTDIGCLLPNEPATRRERVGETTHRFWKPNDPVEFESPETSHIEALISFNQYFDSDSKEKFPPASQIISITDIPVEVAEERTPLLSCRVPLPSGRLCPRRDVGGRCRVHGPIVQRDSINGRPINPDDRIRLQAKQIKLSQQKKDSEIRQQKRRNRRQYSQLEDISKTAAKGGQTVLRTRLLHPRSLRKLATALDKDENQQLQGKFSQNFSHAFSR